MSIHIKVSNYRPVKSADLSFDKIALIAADNEGGKTSLTQAVRALTTARVIPIDGLTKAHSGRLVHSGTAVAELSIETPEGSASVTYPESVKKITGKSLEISAFASGEKSILDTEIKLRSNIVCDMLKSSPTKDQLISELAKYGILDSELIESIWKTVQAQGWDSAMANASEKGAKNKGAWQEITGENYGSKKAAEWMPKEWTPDLEPASHQELDETLKQEREWLEVAISSQAVDSAKIAELKKSVATLPALKSELDKVMQETANIYQAREDLRVILRGLPSPEQPLTQKCPHCSGELTVDEHGKLAIHVSITKEEIANRVKSIAQTNESITSASQQLTLKEQETAKVRASILVAQAAEKELAKIQGEKKSDDKMAASVEDCRNRVALAESRLSAFDRNARAKNLSTQISVGQKLIDVLSPAGLRLTNLKNKLSSFNSMMKQLCDIAAWAHVEIKDDMSITYRGTPYMLISGAAQFKTRCVLQVASAKMDGSQLVLIDAADILTSNQSRTGLIKIIAAAGISGIITMAFADKAKVPRLGKIGGKSYWIENGVTEELA
jgi:hypothetical protein